MSRAECRGCARVPEAHVGVRARTLRERVSGRGVDDSSGSARTAPATWDSTLETAADGVGAVALVTIEQRKVAALVASSTSWRCCGKSKPFVGAIRIPDRRDRLSPEIVCHHM